MNVIERDSLYKVFIFEKQMIHFCKYEKKTLKFFIFINELFNY